MEVIWVVADTAPSSGKEVRYGEFAGAEVFQVKWMGYQLFSCSRKSVRESGPWGQSRSMSSINLNH